MAINPLLAKDSTSKEMFPLPAEGEVFFLKRDHIDFSLSGVATRSKMTGSGMFFLSSRRIVFLKKGDISKHTQFSSFELPLNLIRDAAFKQPIFGANYMCGKIEPLVTAENPLQGTSTWRLTFNAGGCGTFLNVFFKLWQSALKREPPNADLLQQLRFGNSAAFSDPNDPSTIYVTQPIPADGPPHIAESNPSSNPPFATAPAGAPPTPQQQQSMPFAAAPGGTPFYGAAPSAPFAPPYVAAPAPPYVAGSAPPYLAGSAPPYLAGPAPPYGAGSTPPYGGGSAPPYGAGLAPPYGAGSAPPYNAGSAPPYGAGSAPPYGAASAPSYASAAQPYGGPAGLPCHAPPYGAAVGVGTSPYGVAGCASSNTSTTTSAAPPCNTAGAAPSHAAAAASPYANASSSQR